MFVGVLVSVSWALRKTPKQVSSLRGLEGVGVSFYISGAPKYSGLTLGDLRTVVELGLRRNGIKVLTPEECRKTNGKPHLDVHVTVVGDKNMDARAATVHIELKQDALLIDRMELSVSTWQKQYTLINSVTAMDAQAKETVKDCVDDFSGDYLSVNPIERPMPEKDEK